MTISDSGVTADVTFHITAPGRINLIGEHTDYNGGLALPASIDRHIAFTARKIAAPRWQLEAADINQLYTLELPITGPAAQQWVNYLAGVGEQFQQLGYQLPGLQLSFGGNLPAGAGMSSSAALETGIAFLLNELLGAGLSRVELARLCQRSSNDFLGVPSGIMDQYASLNGTTAGPILLDCHTLTHRTITNQLEDHQFLLVNSMVTHNLGNSEYPLRVTQCREVLTALQRRSPELPVLCRAAPEDLDLVAGDVSPLSLRRARFVLAENNRVPELAAALSAGDAETAKELLNASHAGLRDDYGVSCPETDFLQDRAVADFPAATVGARIMGGGFGGCTLNLLPTAAISSFTSFITDAYRKAYGITPRCYPVHFAAGVTRTYPSCPGIINNLF